MVASPHELWLVATDFATELADSSRQEYVRWLSAVGNQVILDGRSIKEWFTYKGEVSLWWTTKATSKTKSPARTGGSSTHLL
jgi:hypothetical protein